MSARERLTRLVRTNYPDLVFGRDPQAWKGAARRVAFHADMVRRARLENEKRGRRQRDQEPHDQAGYVYCCEDVGCHADAEVYYRGCPNGKRSTAFMPTKK